MHVFGTAGHVDHGKSTLLRALTGMEPDRLPEERKRGMTIDLNFVWATLNEEPVGFIDVPGHHKFVKNMITGAMTVDAFLFVVAADDGWMPQSQEHFSVLKNLGIRQGLVVVTKADLVDAQRLAEVKKHVKEQFSDVFSAEYFSFSEKKAESIQPIRSAVENLLQQLPVPVTTKKPRLWVDRVFHPKGQGTVVTGTLREGKLKPGDELHVWPNEDRVTVKSIQSYQQSLEVAEPVSRVALQLSRVNSEIDRGVLLEGRHGTEAKVVDVKLDFFEPTSTKNKQLSFHIGTAKIEAYVIPLEKKQPSAQSFFARIKFKTPVRLRYGDAFLLRTPGEEKTLAGGEVVDAQPSTRAHAKTLAALEKWQPGCQGSMAFEVAKQAYVDIRDFRANSVWTESEVLKSLVDFIPVNSSVYLDPARTQTFAQQVEVFLEGAHASQLEWVEVSKLNKVGRQHSGLTPTAVNYILLHLTKEKKVRREGQRIQLSGFEKKIEPWEKNCLKIVAEALAKNEGKPVNLKELPGEFVLVKKALQNHAAGKFVRLAPDFWLGQETYDEYVAAIRAHLREHRQATSSELKGVLGLSRKPAIMILERMDRDRVTFLKEGLRRLLSTV